MPMPEQSSNEWLASLQDDELEAWPDGQRLDDQALLQWRRHLQASALIRGEVIAEPSSTQRLLDAVHAAQAADCEESKPSPSVQADLSPAVSSAATITPAVSRPAAVNQTAANEPRFAWSWVAAVMLAVGVWAWWPQSNAPQSTLVVQQQTAPEISVNRSASDSAPALLTSQGVLRDPQLDALLQSHRQWAGGAGLTFPAGYVRNVALER